MQKSIRYIFGFLGTFSILTCNAIASNESENDSSSNKVVFIQLDSNQEKAHSQLALLKNMDLVGINFETHIAEVQVTKKELEFLKSKKLSIVEKERDFSSKKLGLQGYLTPPEVRDQLTKIHQQYPQITNVFEIGKTHLNLPIMAIEISSSLGDTTRPTIYFNAMHHAREVMSAEVVMHMAKVLTEQYGKDSEITEWLDSYRIFIVPQANPDGNTLVHQGKTMWRKNAWEYLGSKTGVDLNRNYPAYWNYCGGSSGLPFSEIYRGPDAGSEPETQAIMNLIFQIKPVASISYHSYSEMVIYPYGCSNVKNPSKDLFMKVGQTIKAGLRDDKNQLNTYRMGTAPELLYDADGSDDDWLWKEHGVVAYTLEVNASSFQPDYTKWRDVTVVRQEGGWKNLLRQMKSSGFHGIIQAQNPEQITYSIEKSAAGKWIAFDADNMNHTNRQFSLRSQNGLMYQLTEPGEYQIHFYRDQHLLKTIQVRIENQNIDLGNVILE